MANIERGKIFTPEKKEMLVQEVRDELSKVESMLKKNDYVSEIILDLQKIRNELVKILKTLIDKRGVVTPQETDSILDSINVSKKTRLKNDTEYKFKLNFASVLFISLLGYGIYHLTKGKL